MPAVRFVSTHCHPSIGTPKQPLLQAKRTIPAGMVYAFKSREMCYLRIFAIALQEVVLEKIPRPWPKGLENEAFDMALATAVARTARHDTSLSFQCLNTNQEWWEKSYYSALSRKLNPFDSYTGTYKRMVNKSTSTNPPAEPPATPDSSMSPQTCQQVLDHFKQPSPKPIKFKTVSESTLKKLLAAKKK